MSLAALALRNAKKNSLNINESNFIFFFFVRCSREFSGAFATDLYVNIFIFIFWYVYSFGLSLTLSSSLSSSSSFVAAVSEYDSFTLSLYQSVLFY